MRILATFLVAFALPTYAQTPFLANGASEPVQTRTGIVNPRTSGTWTHAGVINIGNQGDWLATALGFPSGVNHTNSLSVVSPGGGSSALFAQRTSDTPALNGGMVPTLNIFNFNDNTRSPGTGYGIYLETRHFPGAGFSQGLEVNSTNIGPSVEPTPYAFDEPGFSASYTASAGRDDIYGARQSNPSVAFGVLGGLETKVRFNSGMVFAAGSVAGEAGIDMPRGLGILMRAPANNITGRIRSDATSDPGGASLIFTNTGVVVQDLNGTAMLTMSPTATNIGEGTLLVANLTSTHSLQIIPHTPASSSEACMAGQVEVDSNYLYICTAPNTLKRVALSAF